MAFEHDDVEQSRGFYNELHTANFAKAREWSNGLKTTEVRIPEPDLESHFEAIWGRGGDDYRDTIECWRGDGILTNLAVIRHGESGTRSFVVDTSDLIIGESEDTFFFYMIGKCWAIVLDIKDRDGNVVRAVYHLPGITARKDSNLGELIKVLGDDGQLIKLTIFFNSKHNTDNPEDIVKLVLPESLATQFVDMNGLDSSGCHDLFVKGNRAFQYYNVGLFDEETEAMRIDRISSGEWKID